MDDLSTDDDRDQLGEAIVDADEDLAVEVLNAYPTLDVNRPWRMEHLICRACEANMPTLVKALIKRGADVNQTNAHGYSNLELGCRAASDDLVNLLLDHNANLVPSSPHRTTSLHWAVQYGSMPTIKRLLDDGAPVNAISDFGSPLHLVIRAGRANRREVIEHLLDRGADLNVTDDKGRTPMMLARDQNDDALVRTLIDHERQTLSAALDVPAVTTLVRGRRL